MMRYLVTGAQGFVGRFVVANLLQSSDDLHVMGVGRSAATRDRFTHTINWCGDKRYAPLPPKIASVLATDSRYEYQQVDLQDSASISRVVANYSPSHVIHLASGLFGDPVDKLFRCNVEGTVNLLQSIAATRDSAPRIVLGSSGGVYGAVERLPIHESDTATPVHMYTVSKLAAEMAASVIAQRHGMPIMFARIFNIVGPGQDERHVCGRWLNELTAIALERKPPVLEVGNLDSTRDMIDVRDTASACIALAQRGEGGEIYNVASGRETRMRGMLDLCLDTAGVRTQVDVKELPPRPNDIPRHFATTKKLESLGWRPEFALEESLHDLHQYYVSQVAPNVNASQQSGKVNSGELK